jgi:hypothetical protein
MVRTAPLLRPVFLRLKANGGQPTTRVSERPESWAFMAELRSLA